MRYPDPALCEGLKTESKTVFEYMYGINDDTGDTAGKDDVLKDCVNMEYTGKTLTTRAGFRAKADSLFSPDEFTDTVYLPFTVTDTVCFINGKPENLAYCCTGDVSRATVYFFLTDSDGNISPAGSIVFSRIDYSHFYIPRNVFFTVSRKSRGSGVYAFIYRKSGDDVLSGVYEASSDFSEWLSSADSYYVPVISVNGRGNHYDMAHTAINLNLPEPKRVEDLNVLTGKFRCYFTSDNFSCYFRLPYGDLYEYGSLNCRIYTEPDEYTEWNILPLETHASATFLGETVHLYLDRSLGLLRFWKSPEDYSVPMMPNCKLNNIAVTAQTAPDEFLDALMTSKGSVNLNNRIYLYGNQERGNCIFCAKAGNPFYFPKNSKLFLSDGTTPVTSLKVQNGKLIAFKPGETYRVVTSAENENGVEADLPDGSVYLKGDVMTAQTIDNNIGCSCPETVRLCGNRLVWLSNDGAVYALATTTYGNTTNIFRVSQPLGGRLRDALKTAEKVFAVTNGGQYMLFADKTVFVMNHRVRGFGYMKSYYAHDDDIKSPAWYVWTLPDETCFCGGAVVDGSPVLISSFGEGLYFYTSVPDGDCDSAIFLSDGEIKTVNVPYGSGFTTKYFDMDAPHLAKRLTKILVSSSSPARATLMLFDGVRRYSRTVSLTGGADFLSLIGGVPHFKRIGVSLYSRTALTVESVSLIYKISGKR